MKTRDVFDDQYKIVSLKAESKILPGVGPALRIWVFGIESRIETEVQDRLKVFREHVLHNLSNYL